MFPALLSKIPAAQNHQKPPHNMDCSISPTHFMPSIKPLHLLNPSPQLVQVIRANNMKHQLLFLVFLLATFSIVSAQSPAQAPAPPGPANITAILVKAGQFSTFIHLLQTTQVADQITTQLNNSDQGQTVFAPTDSAFSSLPSGTLNSLNDQQMEKLIQFHVLPTVLSLSQLRTASNPLRTQAGKSDSGDFPLDVTTAGKQVNITTGVVNATVSKRIYKDHQLDVYQVDQVLLPFKLFGTPAPTMAPAPSPLEPNQTPKSPVSSDDAAGDKTTDSSHGLTLRDLTKVPVGVSMVAAFLLMLI